MRPSLGGRNDASIETLAMDFEARSVLYGVALCALGRGGSDGMPSNADEARGQRQFIEAQFTDPDTLWRPKLGLPNRIQSIT